MIAKLQIFLYVFCIWIFLKSECKHSKVLIVSYDGFRYNFFDKNVTNFLNKLRIEGTHADYIVNVFTTKTFTNHFSIATGVFPEVHGVLQNEVFDPLYNETIKYSRKLFQYNDDIMPLWTLNELGAEGRHSGVMMWPGGDFKYHNVSPTHLQIFNKSISFDDRVNTVISWFSDPETPANLVFAYFEEPDEVEHKHGPESEATIKQLKILDNLTQQLFQKLKANNLTDVNVLLLSDHGMSTVTIERIINVSNYIANYNYEMVGSSPVLQIVPHNDEDIPKIYSALKEASITNKHFKVYLKDEIPDKWHFKNNRRAGPIIIVADITYGFDDLLKWSDHKRGQAYGIHGYDNDEPDMHPFFIAYGPDIKNNFKVQPFNTVDIYPLVAKMLNLQSLPTNGSLNVIENILHSDSSSILPFLPLRDNLTIALYLLMGFFVLSMVIFIIWILIPGSTAYCCCHKRGFTESRVYTQDLHGIEKEHLLMNDNESSVYS